MPKKTPLKSTSTSPSPTPSKEPGLTPLMKQFWELKEKAGDALLLFRMGDFYELFGDDAVEAAKILDITLTTRDKNKANAMPMAGVPHHSIQGYLQKLLKAGKKVAIGEQIGDPKAKGIVERDIVRTFTPAVQFDQAASETSYLATAIPTLKGQWIAALLEASTGECLISDPLELQELMSELSQRSVRHFLNFGERAPKTLLESYKHLDAVLVEPLPFNYLSIEQAEENLKEQFQLKTVDAFFESREALHALGILLTYASRSQKQERLAHLRLPEPLRQSHVMTLGPNTAKHLDLVPDREGSPNLFDLINQTKSSLGSRKLKSWVLAPLKEVPGIEKCQEAVEAISQHESTHDQLKGLFKEAYDLERILGRVNTGLANPRDTYALASTLRILPALQKALDILKKESSKLKEHQKQIKDSHLKLKSLYEEILETQKEEAPLVSRDGGIFEKGKSKALDKLIELTENGQKWLIDLEAKERKRTGIPNLKVRYNRVFGYYIEVTKTHLDKVPEDYQRKQSMATGERFFTTELKSFEEEIISAESKRKALEQELFNDLLERIKEVTPAIMTSASLIAEIDGLQSLAVLSKYPGWCFPKINQSLEVNIEAGRHPIVDEAAGGSFVPNDLKLSTDDALSLMITGPNMGGKSTIMRQMALIVILGQMGAPVPAANASWGVFHSIFTRIGAHDAIAKGQSTFMVEMTELAHLLHHADERSLVILDEIGRGTSTYDGMSVAWATLEWITHKIKARTLFATHYHELTALDKTLPKLKNAHMAVESEKTGSLTKRDFRFLYELSDGPANESFGIQVAKLAGLPAPIIKRAWSVLEDLEDQNSETPVVNTNQLSLFDFRDTESSDAAGTAETPGLTVQFEPHPVLEQLGDINVDELTPLEALNLIASLKASADKNESA